MNENINEDLFALFGEEIVKQASLIDVANLNMNDEMIKCITIGVTRLKQLKGNVEAQINFVNEMEPGERIMLCMWIMDMNLLEKIQEQ